MMSIHEEPSFRTSQLDTKLILIYCHINRLGGHGELDARSDYDVQSLCYLRLYDSIVRERNLNSA